ncbi:DUF302 domain-containing protein [Paracoccus suum]|uniref:DUF302 domain-containing protein n=1 Tax=Paracoccus suum TaxID=2259340 RepID=A0A344PHW5_9RHOB|nr:DUF302 domain-containing protein [Paracoccus suum]AXC48970.1 DUF302 domain-containing protein [Paracoccus suum]
MILTPRLPVLLAGLMLAAPALAAPPVVTETTGPVADVVAAIEDEIVNAGLVVEGHLLIGDMLSRTKADVGGTKEIFTDAEMFTFCSATVSRAVMERDPSNIQFCPYSIYVYETADAPGKVIVGHPDYAAHGVPEVSELIEKIVKAAVE